MKRTPSVRSEIGDRVDAIEKRLIGEPCAYP